MRLLLILIAVVFAIPALAAEPELWLYYQANLLPEENISKLEGIWRRAAAAGYTKVLLADSKFAMLDDLRGNEGRYLQHVQQVKDLAEELKLQIVPAVFPIGYSNDLLWHDPNLAEGLPVKDALFVVQDGQARLVPEPAVNLAAKPDWCDSALQIRDGVATERGHIENARLVWKVNLSPYRCYHVSVDIRTKDYTAQPEIKALVNGKTSLSFSNLGVERTQDWKRHHIVFSSLAHKQVSIYMGVWGAAKGELSWRNWQIEEAGPVNVLRRPGAPCVVEGYEEGKDYEPIRDAKMGMVPYAGCYEVWHEPPAIRTKLPEGTKLRISWYFAPVIYSDQVGCCPSEPKVMALLADQAARVREAWSAKALMMSHDEVRVLNQDKSCLDRGMTPGAILAENVRRCAELLQGCDLYVWSDMFDPHHNAVDGDYYLVNGSLSGSWEGLDKNVTIMNWNFDKRQQSLRFFAQRGHPQVIAGYYDGEVRAVNQWLDAARGVEGIKGVMYTTWQQKYDDLEAFAKAVRARK